MNNELIKCPVCCSDATMNNDDAFRNFYICPICGRFELSRAEEEDGICSYNKNHLMSFFIYHAYGKGENDQRRNSILDQTECDKYKSEYMNGHNLCGIPIHMDPDVVEAWYPKTFSEKVDRILLYFYNHTNHFGQNYV